MKDWSWKRVLFLSELLLEPQSIWSFCQNAAAESVLLDIPLYYLLITIKQMQAVPPVYVTAKSFFFFLFYIFMERSPEIHKQQPQM